jgi:hypothetical protein
VLGRWPEIHYDLGRNRRLSAKNSANDADHSGAVPGPLRFWSPTTRRFHLLIEETEPMRKFILAAALAATAFAAPAMAHHPVALDALLPGSEIRRSISHGDEMRDEVLKLHADGSLTGNYQVTRSGLSRGVEHRQGRIHGTWAIVQGKLCITGKGLSEGYKTCYSVTKGYHGKREFAAVNLRTGEIWKMFIFPHHAA